MNISRFNLETSEPGHNGTIRTQKVIPADWTKPPFDTAWGYLDGPGVMEGHEHSIEEVYMFFKGNGVVVIGDEERKVSAGDIVEIPVNVYHTVKNVTEGELLWAAVWWEAGQKSS